MLILHRRENESIIIGDDVIVTIMGIEYNRVRVGVDAPKSISVHREEIYDKIREQQGLPPRLRDKK